MEESSIADHEARLLSVPCHFVRSPEPVQPPRPSSTLVAECFGDGHLRSPSGPDATVEPDAESEIDSQVHPVFHHTELSLSSRSIRVLYVLPDISPDRLIQCRLDHITLADEHTCISYMWGSEQSQKSILINGQLFRVRHNLWDFLRLARCRYTSMALWIDAICINQESNSERGHQVTLMGDIYAQSRQVLVWLGSAPSDIPHALARLRAIETEASRPRLELSKVRSTMRFSVYCFIKPLESCQIHGLTELCKLPYWKRVWIKQEIVNAGNTCLLWGDYYCAWEEFARIIRELFTHDSPFSRRYHQLKRCIKDSEAIPLAHLYLSRLSSKLRTLEDPTVFIPRFCFSDCTDPRDRVYGLLGLTILGNTFPVEYTCTPTELFFRTLVHCKKQREVRYRWGSRQYHTSLGALLSLGTSLARALSLNYADLYESKEIDDLMAQRKSLGLEDVRAVDHGRLWSRCTKVKDNRADWTTQCATDSTLARNGATVPSMWYSEEVGLTQPLTSFRKGDVLIKLDCDALFLACCSDDRGIATPFAFLTKVTPPSTDRGDGPLGNANNPDVPHKTVEHGRFQSFHCLGMNSISDHCHDEPIFPLDSRPQKRKANSSAKAAKIAFSIPLRVVVRLIAALWNQWPGLQTDGRRSTVSIQEDWLPKEHDRSTFVFKSSVKWAAGSDLG